jgi:DNA-binding transcriptional LysR family regulator
MDEIDVKLLRAFVEVVRDMSFTRAAARTGVAQPRLSLRLRALEESLGITLLTRTSRRIELTEQGRRFFDAASKVISAADHALAVADSLRAGHAERLVVGATAYRVSQRWAILHALLASQPEIDLRVELGSSFELHDRVRSGALDLAFALGPVPGDLQTLLVSSARIGLAVPSDSRHAGRESVGMDALIGTRLAMFPAIPDKIVHEAIRARLTAHGIHVIEPPEVSAEAMTEFIRESRIGIISAQWWAPEHTPDLSFVHIDEICESMDLYLVSRRKPHSQSAAALWQMVAERFGTETDV